MASTNINLIMRRELKAQAEEILHQHLKEKAVPLSVNLASQNSFYADLLVAKDEQRNEYVGRRGDDMLKDFDVIVAEAEAKYGV